MSPLSSLQLLLLLCGGAPVAPVVGAPLQRVVNLPSTGRFWHITDLHLDPSYTLAADPTKVCFSSKGVPASQAGLYGDFLCDSPYRLIQSAFTHMAQVTPPLDFIIWTGDSPPHVPVGELSTDTVIQVISNMTQTIRNHFPSLTVYPALGNHDYWPQDQMMTSTNAVYQAAAKLWQGWLQPEALRTLTEGGFYSQLVRPGLRVVSLNTILYYSPNQVTVNMSDPAGQFHWLQETLDRAAQSLEKVFIIAHVPVGYLPFARGITAVRERHNERLVTIFRNYSHVIAGHFYGHTHRDSIMVLLDHKGEAVNSLFVSPAITPIKSKLEPYSNNPSFRMYHYHNDNYTLLDLWQYYLNLTEANEKQRAVWALEYIMTEAFGLKDLQPQSLLQLALSFRLPQTRTFHKYFSHFMVNYNNSILCEGECKVCQVCAVLYLDRQGYSTCVARGTL
ncbi:cyclic GMP-AMP phosphodiesterase SMPDL3A [Diretmus argenteus]